MSARWVRFVLAKLFDDRAMEQVIEPLLADASVEHRDAVARGRPLWARWILARTAWDLLLATIALSVFATGDRARATRWRLPLAGLAVALIGVASMGEMGGRQALQACWLGSGALLASLLLLVPSAWLAARRAWFAVALFLLGWVGFAGETYDGATRWVVLGPLRVMPSELCRPLLLLAIAGALTLPGRRGASEALRSRPRLVTQPLWETALMTALVSAAIAWQPDPGAVVVLLAAATMMVTDVAGIGRAILAIAPAIAAAVATITARSSSLAGAWTSGTATGGEPAIDTDLWLAGVEGRFGVAASLIALSLVFLLAYELWTAAREPGPARTIARGAAAALLAQATLHAISALGLLPASTVGLPLLSYGGSGMVGWMLCLMIVARVAGAGRAAPVPVR